MPICLRRVLAAVAIQQLALVCLAACICYSVYAHARACMYCALVSISYVSEREGISRSNGRGFHMVALALSAETFTDAMELDMAIYQAGQGHGSKGERLQPTRRLQPTAV